MITSVHVRRRTNTTLKAHGLAFVASASRSAGGKAHVQVASAISDDNYNGRIGSSSRIRYVYISMPWMISSLIIIDMMRDGIIHDKLVHITNYSKY